MKIKSALCLLLVTTAFAATAQLPEVTDVAYNPATRHVYLLLSPSDWVSAEAAAVSLGGHLVTINDQAENDWLYNLWGTTATLMIGLTDAASEGNFVWTSGEPFTFSNWTDGEPNNGVGWGQEPENYAFMYSEGFGTPGKWNDTKGLQDIWPQPELQGVVEISRPAQGIEHRPVRSWHTERPKR